MVLLLILMTSAIVVAKETNSNVETQDICNYIKEKVEVGGEIPGFIPFQDERFNIYNFDNEVIGHLISEDGVLTSISCTNITNPSYNLYINSLEVAQMIGEGESSLRQFNEAKAKNLIRLEGTSFGKKVKGSITSIIMKIAGWF